MNITDKLSSKSQALIAILMTKKRLRCSRKELIGYLWPESSEEAAKYNLRFNLWQLRKTICVQPSGQPFLIITRDDCQINEKYSYQCDFRQIIEADGSNPIEPLITEPSSVRISPNVFSVTITSKKAGS